jgi:EAL domain-containing protein (putative c-di-GMP-specific phosphodiesterase class I)
MYRAKERGRNNYQFFSEDMNARAARLLRTENELRQALERSEFVLYHQPKYRIEDGTLGGVECLVRWQHPERGLVGPGEFIDVAEDTGAIVPLGSWIIEAACEAAKLFADLSQRNFVTAVNISPRQFRDPNLVNTIRRCLRTCGLAPENLQVEITETMLMQDIAAAEMTVARLHELGIQLAIDDFGTGYSSLNYLKRFPINTVKVDRSFVKDIPGSEDDCAITAAVIAMAHRLQMAVVAEGVETDEQIAFLRQHGCEFAQGFRYSKPVPLEAMRLMIQRDNLKDTPKSIVTA